MCVPHFNTLRVRSDSKNVSPSTFTAMGEVDHIPRVDGATLFPIGGVVEGLIELPASGFEIGAAMIELVRL